MGAMKQFAMEVSGKKGLGGLLTLEVIEEADRVLALLESGTEREEAFSTITPTDLTRAEIEALWRKSEGVEDQLWERASVDALVAEAIKRDEEEMDTRSLYLDQVNQS